MLYLKIISDPLSAKYGTGAIFADREKLDLILLLCFPGLDFYNYCVRYSEDVDNWSPQYPKDYGMMRFVYVVAN